MIKVLNRTMHHLVASMTVDHAYVCNSKHSYYAASNLLN